MRNERKNRPRRASETAFLCLRKQFESFLGDIFPYFLQQLRGKVGYTNTAWVWEGGKHVFLKPRVCHTIQFNSISIPSHESAASFFRLFWVIWFTSFSQAFCNTSYARVELIGVFLGPWASLSCFWRRFFLVHKQNQIKIF